MTRIVIYEANSKTLHNKPTDITLTQLPAQLQQIDFQQALFRRLKPIVWEIACQFPIYLQLILENALAEAAIRAMHNERIVAQPMLEITDAKFLGRHVLAEFDITNSPFNNKIRDAVNPQKILQAILVKAAKVAEATILNREFLDRGFGRTPNGDMWGIVVIEESHLSVHYRQANNLLSIDIYTCGDIKLDDAFDYITWQLQTDPFDMIEFKRGIHQQDNRFVPGVAIASNKPDKASPLSFFKPTQLLQALGQHGFAEFYCCDPNKINDSSYVLESFHKALHEGGIEDFTGFHFAHKFSPQGVSAVMIGPGMHLTIHDWPEHGYASVDICAFGNTVDIDKVLSKLKERFDAPKMEVRILPRGVVNSYGVLQPAFNKLLLQGEVESKQRLRN